LICPAAEKFAVEGLANLKRTCAIRWLGQLSHMTDWDERYKLGDTPWDKGAAAPPLMELIERLGTGIFGGGPVLVPGSGLGYDVRALAHAGLSAVGVDLSETAVQRARQFPTVGGEAYEVGDFLNPGWLGDRKFSAIWEHTCFCAIDPEMRPDYAKAAATVLEEGGVFSGVFYLNPYDPGEEAKGPPFGTTMDELDRRFSPWFEKVAGWVPERAFPGREGREWVGVFRKLANGSMFAAKT
jgi:methyl halide transferase